MTSELIPFLSNNGLLLITLISGACFGIYTLILTYHTKRYSLAPKGAILLVGVQTILGAFIFISAFLISMSL